MVNESAERWVEATVRRFAALSLAALGVLDAELSFAGALTMTVRVEVAVRPVGSVTT